MFQPDYYDYLMPMHVQILNDCNQTMVRDYPQLDHDCTDDCPAPCPQMDALLLQCFKVLRDQVIETINGSTLPFPVRMAYFRAMLVHVELYKVNLDAMDAMAKISFVEHHGEQRYLIHPHICLPTQHKEFYSLFGPLGAADVYRIQPQIYQSLRFVRMKDSGLLYKRYLWYVKTEEAADDLLLIASDDMTARAAFLKLHRLAGSRNPDGAPMNMTRHVRSIERLEELPDVDNIIVGSDERAVKNIRELVPQSTQYLNHQCLLEMGFELIDQFEHRKEYKREGRHYQVTMPLLDGYLRGLERSPQGAILLYHPDNAPKIIANLN